MDNNVVSIGVRADLAPLQGGVKQAEAIVKQASANMSDALSQFGKAAEAGNAQAAAALKAYEAELRQAEQVLSTFAETERQEESVMRGGISTRMAASAELRVFEGNLQGSTRAAAALLTQSKALSGAIQLAFPIFGAVALVSILAQAASKVMDLKHAFDALDGAETKAGFDAILAGEKIIKIKPEKFSADAFARTVEGAAPNKNIEIANAQTALKQIQYARELQDAQAQVTEQALTGAALQKQKIADIQREIDFTRQAKEQADALTAAYVKQGEAQTKIVTIVAGHSGVVRSTQSVTNITDPKQIEALQQQARTAAQAAEQYQHDIEMLQVKMQGAAAKLPRVEDKEGSQQQKQAAEQLLRQMETEYAAQKAAGDINVIAERAFWASKLSAFREGSTQYLEVLNKVATLTGEAHKLESETVKRYAEEQTRDYEQSERVMEAASKSMSAVMLTQAEDVLRTGERWKSYNDEVAKAAEIQAQNAAKLAEVNVRTLEAQGGLTKHAAAMAEASIHAQDYTAKLAALDAQLKQVAADENLTPSQKATQTQGIQNQVLQLNGQNQSQGAQDQAAVTQSISQPYINAFNSINNQWLQLQNKLIFGTRNVGQAFANMGVGILQSVAASWEKMVVNSLEAELRMTIAHQQAQALQTAGTVTGQTAQTAAVITAKQLQVAATVNASNQTQAISLFTALKEITHSAGSAAAKAYSAEAGIPIVGPILGAIAAATTFAAVEAFAAFETGGIIPNTGVALVHQGEAVLPRNLTSMLMNTANDNRSSSSSAVTQNIHTNGMSDTAFRTMLMRNSNHAVKAVQRGLRNKGQG